MSTLSLSGTTKILILASLISLLLFVGYWTWQSYDNFFGFLFRSNAGQVRYVERLGIVFWAGHIGLTARLLGVGMGIVAFFLFLGKTKNKITAKNLVAAALLLESLYFFLYFPFVPYLWGPGSYYLSLAYLLQIPLITPLLAVLAIKVRNYKTDAPNVNFWKWADAAFVGYVAALWVNSLFRWFDMGRQEGVIFLFTGMVSIGFLNALIVMTLAVVFSLMAAVSYSRKRNIALAKRWTGLALTMVGLHFIIYLVYSYMVNALSFALLVDVWTVPLFFLGVALIFESTKKAS